MRAYEVVVGVFYLVIGVAVDVVHQEAQDLFVGDIARRERQVVDLRRGQLFRPLREIALGVCAEHVERHAHARKIAVVLLARVGVGADGVAEVVQRRGVHHRVEVDGAQHLALLVEEDVVDFRVVVGHARGDRAVLDLRPEPEHLAAPRLDPADLLRQILHAPCGVAA